MYMYQIIRFVFQKGVTDMVPCIIRQQGATFTCIYQNLYLIPSGRLFLDGKTRALHVSLKTFLADLYVSMVTS